MASRTGFRKGGRYYRLWLRFDTENRKGFPDKLVGKVAALMGNPRWSSQVKGADKNMLIVTPRVFDAIQSELDLVPKSYASLYAEDTSSGRFKALKAYSRCKMYGDKVEYDKLLRTLRF